MSQTAEVLENKDSTIMLNFLRPQYFTDLDIENLTVEFDEEVPDDLLECMDLCQWLIFKGLFDKSFEYDSNDKEYLSVRLCLDEFLMSRFFDNSDADYLNQILELFASILEDAGWSDVDYIFKLLSEEEGVTHEELAEHLGDDPVTEIVIEMKMYDPKIQQSPIPLKKNLND